MHHPADLLGLVVSTLGIAVVMLIAVYARGTAVGVAQDVQAVNSLLRGILVVPVTVLEGLVTIVAPVAVLAELATRRLWRQVLEVTAAGVVELTLLKAPIRTVLVTLQV